MKLFLHESKTQMSLRYDLFVPTAAKLVEFMQGTNFQNPEGKSPFEYTFQQHLWEHTGENPQVQVDMMNYMAGRRKGSVRWPEIFPIASRLDSAFRDKENAVLLADIGGNQGHDLKLLKEQEPDLPGRLVLMDLPEVVNKVITPLEGIEVIPYDFFTPQPIKGILLDRYP
jgi:hypothetical protein